MPELSPDALNVLCDNCTIPNLQGVSQFLSLQATRVIVRRGIAPEVAEETLMQEYHFTKYEAKAAAVCVATCFNHGSGNIRLVTNEGEA